MRVLVSGWDTVNLCVGGIRCSCLTVSCPRGGGIRRGKKKKKEKERDIRRQLKDKASGMDIEHFTLGQPTHRLIVRPLPPPLSPPLPPSTPLH